MRRFALASLVAAVLLALTAPALATAPNEQPEAPPEVPTGESAPATSEPAKPAAPPPAAGAQNDARIDALEQLVRVEARKRELAEEAAAAQRAEGPLVIANDSGFTIKSVDSSYVLRLRGQLQIDGRFFAHDDALEANDTFLVRRFRPTLEGTLFSFADFRFVPELAGTPTILDAYLDLHPRPWLRLRLGKFKTPIGLERLQNDADLPIVERALDSNLSSQRDVGALLWGDVAGGVVQYIVGVVNGTADTTAGDTDLDHAKDFLGRLFLQPFSAPSLREYGSLGLGLAVQSGNRKGRLPTAVPGLVIPSVPAQTGLAPFKTFGQNTFFSYYAPATDTTGASTTFTHDRTTHLNPQLFYYYDNFGLLAEYLYLWQGVQRGNSTTTLKHQAAHATLTFTIGGRESFEGVTPLEPFNPATRAPGAFQIAARWDWIKLDPATFGNPAVVGSTAYADPLKNASGAQSFAGGVAWVPRRTVRLAIDFSRTRFTGGAGTAAVAAIPGEPAVPAVLFDRNVEYAFIGRAQVNF
jgi:phosphate-selective porin OprO and OprP